MNKLTCFDFDGTLCDTKDMTEGKTIWEKKNKAIWPYRGWWGRVGSIDWETFKTTSIKDVCDKYHLEINQSDYVILATGRLNSVVGMRDAVEKILSMNNLSFSEIEIDGDKSNGIFLNPGGDTFKFKTSLFEFLIDRLNITDFVMYDDRQEHLPKFIEWAKKQNANITVVDVINWTTKTIQNIKI